MKRKNNIKIWRNRIGLTILETLLAMTLFTIVMTSSYGIFSMGMDLWRRTQGSSKYERQALLAFEKMGRDVRMVIKTKDQELLGEGDDDEVKLPALIEVEDSKGNFIPQYGWKIYKYKSSSKELCYKEQVSGEKEPSDSDCRALARYVKKLKFQYWIYDGIGESYSWYSNFDTKDGVPQAMRVELHLNEKIGKDKIAIKRTYERLFLIPVGGEQHAEEETL